MGKINSRAKGQRGERQVIELLQPIIDNVYAQTNDYLKAVNGGGLGNAGMALNAPKLQRNTLQSDSGGFDIVGLDWLALEVKNVETSEPSMVDKWWVQAVTQAKKAKVGKDSVASEKRGNEKRAVLFYKRNRTRWRVRMKGYLSVSSSPEADVKRVVIIADISCEEFLKWFEMRLLEEMRVLVMKIQ